MARLERPGLDYYSMPCDALDDPMFAPLWIEMGQKWLGVWLELTAQVCSRRGYWAKYDNSLVLHCVTKPFAVSAEFVRKVVAALVKCGYFDEATFQSAQVLTSEELQRQWLTVKSVRKKHGLGQLPYWLLSDEETERLRSRSPWTASQRYARELTDVKEINENKPLRDTFNTSGPQSKVKERKGKEEYNNEENKKEKKEKNAKALPMKGSDGAAAPARGRMTVEEFCRRWETNRAKNGSPIFAGTMHPTLRADIEDFLATVPPEDWGAFILGAQTDSYANGRTKNHPQPADFAWLFEQRFGEGKRIARFIDAGRMRYARQQAALLRAEQQAALLRARQAQPTEADDGERKPTTT